MNKEQSTRSTFTAFLNPKANVDNKLPNMTGQFALTDDKTYKFSAWANYSARGSLYMKGTHTPKDLTEALIAQIVPAGAATAGPADIDIKPGEFILFENVAKHGDAEDETNEDKAKRAKRPDWYGYARTSSHWFQLAGWARDAQSKSGFIAGTVAEYKPQPDAEPSQEPPNSKGRSTRGIHSKTAPQI